MALAVSSALKKQAPERAEGAVTPAMLDAYASQARASHTINSAKRYQAARYAVVEPRFVRLVRAQMLEEKAEEMGAQAALERRAAR